MTIATLFCEPVSKVVAIADECRLDMCGTSPGPDPDHRNRDQKMELSRDQTGTGTEIKMSIYLIYKILSLFYF